MTVDNALSDDGVNGFVAAVLRSFVGSTPGKALSWGELSVMTGDEERKLRSYVEPGARMPLPVAMRVFALLPPEAWGLVCRRMGFAPPGRVEVEADAGVRRAMAVGARLVAEAAGAIEDGQVTHRERLALARHAREALPVWQSLADYEP